MVELKKVNRVISAPKHGKAQIVFMRPSNFGFAKQLSIFEMSDKEPSIVGILKTKTKVVYSANAGKYTFLVNNFGQESRMMTATLEANKTYYVNTELSAWNGSSYFVPLGKNVAFKDIKSYLNSCQLVENDERSKTWAKNNLPDIIENYKVAKEIWQDSNEKDRAKLLAVDGR